MDLQDLVLLPVGEIEFASFFLNLVLATVLAHCLAKVYVICGTSLSNRRNLSHTFVILTLTILLVISVVKTSLALSLGLIGALSIVRFRAAIKEPEELVYLFIAIALGLGFGADQKFVTTIVFIFMIGFIYARHRLVSSSNYNEEGVFLSINANDIELAVIQSTLESIPLVYHLKRFDREEDRVEAVFLVRLEDNLSVQLMDTAFRSLDPTIRVSLMDSHTNTFASS
jgi:hypothetical protein